jgi:hypothetical protein
MKEHIVYEVWLEKNDVFEFYLNENKIITPTNRALEKVNFDNRFSAGPTLNVADISVDRYVYDCLDRIAPLILGIPNANIFVVKKRIDPGIIEVAVVARTGFAKNFEPMYQDILDYRLGKKYKE